MRLMTWRAVSMSTHPGFMVMAHQALYLRPISVPSQDGR